MTMCDDCGKELPEERALSLCERCEASLSNLRAYYLSKAPPSVASLGPFTSTPPEEEGEYLFVGYLTAYSYGRVRTHRFRVARTQPNGKLLAFGEGDIVPPSTLTRGEWARFTGLDEIARKVEARERSELVSQAIANRPAYVCEPGDVRELVWLLTRVKKNLSEKEAEEIAAWHFITMELNSESEP